jgi:membrane protein
MVAVIEGLNVAYRVPEKRRWWRRRIVALTLTVCMGLLALVATTLTAAGDTVARLVGSVVSASNILVMTSALAQWTVAGFSMLIGLLIIYRFAPNLSDQGVEAVLPGAAVALVGWFAASAAFRLYLTVFDSFSRTYGSLGAVMVLLLWLYLSAASILLGGVVNSAIRAAGRSVNSAS